MDGVDDDAAVVVDIDLDVVVAIFDDAVDDLALAADDFADLVGNDVETLHLEGIFGQFSPRLRDGGEEDIEDLLSGGFGLGQGFPQDVLGDAADLDVHLEGSDAVGGSGDLEVHVAEVIFHALDVGEDGVGVIAVERSGSDETHGDAGDGSLDRNAGIHQGHA